MNYLLSVRFRSIGPQTPDTKAVRRWRVKIIEELAHQRDLAELVVRLVPILLAGCHFILP